METLQYIFPLHQAHPLPALPTPAQIPPSPSPPGTPLIPDNPRKAHVLVDIPNTPVIVVVSSDDEPMGGFDSEDGPKEDQEIDEKVEEQQMDQEVMRHSESSRLIRRLIR